MVLAHHIIFTAYGFWLPNDPRGSWSEWVASWELLKYGKATKTRERRSLAHNIHDIDQRLAAKAGLSRPPVKFNGRQALSIAKGIAQAIRQSGYVFYACSILEDRVHAVVDRHASLAERIAGHLKSEATKQLRRDGLHPFDDGTDPDARVPTVWVEGCWKKYLNSIEDIRRSIEYVEDNPLKDGKRKQEWSFVMPFRGERR